MTFKEAHCPILACPANKGEDGCYCGYIVYGLPCAHPRFRDQWRERTGYQDPPAVDAEAGAVAARSLTARVAEARRSGAELTPERARQMALQLEVGSDVRQP